MLIGGRKLVGEVSHLLANDPHLLAVTSVGREKLDLSATADLTRRRAAASRNEVLTASESLSPPARITSRAAADASSSRT